MTRILKIMLASVASTATMAALTAAFAANDPAPVTPHVINSQPAASDGGSAPLTNGANQDSRQREAQAGGYQLPEKRQPSGGGWKPPKLEQKNAPQAAQPNAGQAAAPINEIKGKRKERREQGGKRVVIQEPGNRTIMQQNNRIAIDRDERESMRRFAPNAKIEKGPGGNSVAVTERGGDKIFSETDDQGRLLRRYRRDASGRDNVIIDNRRRDRNRGRDVATGVAIGAGAVAGAVLLDSLVRVPQPRITIPREKYIVRGDVASDDDYYEALSAPPVGRYNDRYTLDEIRATPYLRDRMRRVDLDDINFAFGSWEIDPSQYRKLERLARAINRVLRRDPDEVFLIEGHTDAVGSRIDNLTLSDRRADTIAYVLSREFGVPFEALATQGYGEEYLKIPTQAPERFNRRVAVRRITPLLARGDYAPRAEGPPRYERVYEKDYDDVPPPPPLPPRPPRDYGDPYDDGLPPPPPPPRY